MQFTLGLRIYVPMYMYIHLFEQVEEKMLPSSLHSFSTLPQVLCSVIDVQSVIEFVAACFLCRGQDDECYISLILERKGKFMDATGTCTCVYVHTVHTIIHKGFVVCNKIFAVHRFYRLFLTFPQETSVWLTWMLDILPFVHLSVSSLYHSNMSNKMGSPDVRSATYTVII